MLSEREKIELEYLRLKKKKALSTQSGPWEKYQNVQQQPSSNIPPVNNTQSIEDAENNIAVEKQDVPADMAVSQGIYRGLGADLLGGPVDITTMALNAGGALLNKIPGVDINPIQNPVGGSDWIADKVSSGASTLGYPVFDPNQIEGSDKLAYNVARFGSGAGAGGLALASRAAKAGQAAQNTGKIEQALTAPYQTNAGRQIVDDTIAGAGAGAGFDIAQNIAPDSPLAQIVGTILGGGGASVGSRVAESGGKAVGRGVVKSTPGKALLPDSIQDKVEFYNERLPDDSVVSRQTVNDASKIMQQISTDPERASQNISNLIGQADENGTTRLTTGVAADDVGLGSFENYQRTNDPKSYLERDQQIRTDVSSSINKLKEPDADIEAPQRLFREKAERLKKENIKERDLARDKLSKTELEREKIDRDVEDITQPFLSKKGRKAEASEALSEQIGEEGVLGERTKIKNIKFEEAAGDKKVSVEPISDSLNKIQSKISKLPIGEDSGLPSDFKDRVKNLVEKGEEVPLKDITGLRKNISTAIGKARKAGNFDTADNLSKLKKDINEYIDDIPSFDDAQKYYKEEYAPFFGEGYGKKFRDTVQRGEGVDSSDPANIAKMFLEKTPDAARDLKRIIDIAPNDKAANEAVENYMVADFASSIGNNPSPRTINSWITNRSSQLNQFPILKKKFQDLQSNVKGKEIQKDELKIKINKLADDFKSAEKNLDETTRRVNRGVFGALIGSDPNKYVRKIMSANNDTILQDIDEINDVIGKNQQAKKGFKRAVTEDLLRRIEGSNIKAVDNEGSEILYQKINDIMKENSEALAKVYNPEEMNALRRSQKILAQYGNLSKRATSGSDTAVLQKQQNRNMLDALETGFRLKYGVLKAGGVMRTIKGAARLLPEGRVTKANRLVARAMLDPEIAVHLLDNPVNLIGSAKWNKKLTFLLAGGAGIRESVDADEQKEEK